jgi:integrase
MKLPEAASSIVFPPSEARGTRWEDWSRTDQHIAIRRSVWHREVGPTKTEKSERFVPVTPDLREILLDLWKAKSSPIGGYILAGRRDHPTVLDNLSKRLIRPLLEEKGISWAGWYSLRRFHATVVRQSSGSSETAAKALGNSKDVCDARYIKNVNVFPDVCRAVNDGLLGIVQ